MLDNKHHSGPICAQKCAVVIFRKGNRLKQKSSKRQNKHLYFFSVLYCVRMKQSVTLVNTASRPKMSNICICLWALVPKLMEWQKGLKEHI